MSVTCCTGYIYLLGRLDWRGKSEVATNRKWARVRLERIGRPWKGGRGYIIAVQEGLLFLVGWLSPLFNFLKKWLPWFAEIEATISVHIIWIHFYFYGFFDETVPVSLRRRGITQKGTYYNWNTAKAGKQDWFFCFYAYATMHGQTHIKNLDCVTVVNRWIFRVLCGNATVKLRQFYTKEFSWRCKVDL